MAKPSRKKAPMSTLPIAASAAQYSHHGDPPAWVLVAGGIYFASVILTWVLVGIIRVMPAGRWRNRLHAANILLCCLSSFQMSEASRKSVHDQARNLYAVWRKKHVGMIIVCISPDDSIHREPVVRAWWEGGEVVGTFATGGWVNISDLLRQGQRQTSNGGWFFTPERWAVVEPEIRAFHEEQRRQDAAQQHAAFSKEVMDALAVLGLTPTATIDDVTDARNRLMQVNHPDHGGSTATAQRINAAHDFLRSAVRQAA
jgi:hypothetical protein